MPSHASLEKLRRNRGYVLVLAFVVSAAVMPTDAILMAIMAVSMYLVYEVGLFLARFFLKGSRRRAVVTGWVGKLTHRNALQLVFRVPKDCQPVTGSSQIICKKIAFLSIFAYDLE